MASVTAEFERLSARPTLWQRLRELYDRRETIRFLTVSNLRAGHRDKVLGHLWNLLDPLMFMLVYFFVFGVLFRLVRGTGRSVEFMLYILTGLLVFRFVSGTITQAATCIRTNRGLIHEISFPKSVLPVSVTLSRLYDFVWGLGALLAFLLFSGTWPTIHYLWVPLLISLLVLFSAGVGFLIGYIGAFFADTPNAVAVAMRLLFYCSPIFYYVRPHPGGGDSLVFFEKHELAQRIYMLNPLACFYESFRDAMLWGRMPEPGMMAYLGAVSLVCCFVGFAVFTRGEGKFAKYV